MNHFNGIVHVPAFSLSTVPSTGGGLPSPEIGFGPRNLHPSNADEPLLHVEQVLPELFFVPDGEPWELVQSDTGPRGCDRDRSS